MAVPIAKLRGMSYELEIKLKERGIYNHLPTDLRAELVATNEQEWLAGRLPTLKVVEDWMLQATDLPEVLEL